PQRGDRSRTALACLKNVIAAVGSPHTATLPLGLAPTRQQFVWFGTVFAHLPQRRSVGFHVANRKPNAISVRREPQAERPPGKCRQFRNLVPSSGGDVEIKLFRENQRFTIRRPRGVIPDNLP